MKQSSQSLCCVRLWAVCKLYEGMSLLGAELCSREYGRGGSKRRW